MQRYTFLESRCKSSNKNLGLIEYKKRSRLHLNNLLPFHWNLLKLLFGRVEDYNTVVALAHHVAEEGFNVIDCN